MGSSLMKFRLKMRMMCRRNLFTKASLRRENVEDLLFPVRSDFKIPSCEKLSCYLLNRITTGINSTNMYSEIPVESLQLENSQPDAAEDDGVQHDIKHMSDCLTKLHANHQKSQIEKLGIYEILSDKEQSYCGTIYVPECFTILVHYITLYRLKLDTLDQTDFKKWCISVGHEKTTTKYLDMQRIYFKMKNQHCKESFIINKILSRQNVQVKITDIFGDIQKPLRAFVVFGKRRNTVQGIINSYSFDLQGKVPFVIKSIEDYKRIFQVPGHKDTIQAKSDESTCVNYKLYPQTLPNNVSIKSARVPLIVNGRLTDEIRNPNSVNILKSERVDFSQDSFSHSDLLYEPFTNYLRLQKQKTEVGDLCYSSPILYEGAQYNLVSVIADKTFAYILCKNSDFRLSSYNEMDLKNLMNEDSTDADQNNKSNSFSRFMTLKRIMKTEIFETFSQKYLGVPLNQIPCGQYHVVQCTVEGRISERESQVNKILTHHMIFGKIISKEYHLEVKGYGDINFIIHLHGNERHIRRCCETLKKERLAYSFTLVHPSSGKIFQEKNIIC